MKAYAVFSIAAVALFFSGYAPSHAQAVEGGSNYVRIGGGAAQARHESPDANARQPAPLSGAQENAGRGRTFDSSHNYVVITPKSDCLDDMRRDNPDKVIPDYAVSYTDCMKYKREKERKKKEVTAVEAQDKPETETPEKEKTLFHLLKRKFRALGDARPATPEDGAAAFNH